MSTTVDADLQLRLIGSLFGRSAAIIGAIVTRLVQLWSEGIRERRRLQREALRMALEWAEQARHKLRRSMPF